MLTQRGPGVNTRLINNIAMENEDFCDSLLVTEVFARSRKWARYPMHRYDSKYFLRMICLEDTYCHRLNPNQGHGIRRVFTDDGSLETMAVAAHHPCGVPYGYEMYYLNVMAGPIRKWRYENHPDHDWIWQRDNASRASVRLGSDTAADLSVGAASRQNAGVLARFSAFRRVIPAERR